MKLYITYLLILITISSSCIGKNKTNEIEIAKRVDVYAKNPTKNNGIKVLEIVPEVQSDSIGMIYTDELMNTLETQIQNQNPLALQLAIRLINIADGAFALDLYVIIVNTITHHPVFFLEEIKKVKEPSLVKSVVLNMGESYLEGKNECEVLLDRKRVLTKLALQESVWVNSRV